MALERETICNKHITQRSSELIINQSCLAEPDRSTGTKPAMKTCVRYALSDVQDESIWGSGLRLFERPPADDNINNYGGGGSDDDAGSGGRGNYDNGNTYIHIITLLDLDIFHLMIIVDPFLDS